MTTSRAAAGGDTADATPESGIVWVYHFQPDGTAELVPNERVEQALADHVGWTWVHLSLADTRCRAWVANNPRLSELAREVLVGPGCAVGLGCRCGGEREVHQGTKVHGGPALRRA